MKVTFMNLNNNDTEHEIIFLSLTKYASGDRELPAERTHMENMEKRRELDEMPFDRNGYHATGYEVCLGNPENPADWWDEFVDEQGNLYYYR